MAKRQNLARIYVERGPEYTEVTASLVFLAILGALGAKAGGAAVPRATVQVTFWGSLALGVTAGSGSLFGKVV